MIIKITQKLIDRLRANHSENCSNDIHFPCLVETPVGEALGQTVTVTASGAVRTRLGYHLGKVGKNVLVLQEAYDNHQWDKLYPMEFEFTQCEQEKKG